MHNKLTRSYITFCLFCLVSCLLPPGGFTAFEEYRSFYEQHTKARGMRTTLAITGDACFVSPCFN